MATDVAKAYTRQHTQSRANKFNQTFELVKIVARFGKTKNRSRLCYNFLLICVPLHAVWSNLSNSQPHPEFNFFLLNNIFAIFHCSKFWLKLIIDSFICMHMRMASKRIQLAFMNNTNKWEVERGRLCSGCVLILYVFAVSLYYFCLSCNIRIAHTIQNRKCIKLCNRFIYAPIAIKKKRNEKPRCYGKRERKKKNTTHFPKPTENSIKHVKCFKRNNNIIDTQNVIQPLPLWSCFAHRSFFHSFSSNLKFNF